MEEMAAVTIRVTLCIGNPSSSPEAGCGYVAAGAIKMLGANAETIWRFAGEFPLNWYASR
jgi:hypothetical protein